MRIWDIVLCKAVMVLSGHTQSVTGIKWGGEGLLYTASQDRTIKVWRTKDVSFFVYGETTGPRTRQPLCLSNRHCVDHTHTHTHTQLHGGGGARMRVRMRSTCLALAS